MNFLDVGIKTVLTDLKGAQALSPSLAEQHVLAYCTLMIIISFSGIDNGIPY